MDASVNVLPSDPVTITAVALLAATVKVDELPTTIDVGLAKMLTVGGLMAATVTVAEADTLPPIPIAVAV